MNEAFILLWMIFFHIVDDYYLQGWLASAKQKSWWKNNSPDPLYKNDYIWALIMHAFSWTFMIMLPIAYTMSFNISEIFATVFVCNWIIHIKVDDLKANKRKINLWQDQVIHLMQILITFFVLVYV